MSVKAIALGAAKALKIVFTALLTVATLGYAFLLALARVDTSEELRFDLCVGVVIGLSMGLLTYLWFHKRIRARLAERSFLVYLAVSVAFWICWALWQLAKAGIRNTALRS